jgi:hypothetical protein
MARALGSENNRSLSVAVLSSASRGALLRDAAEQGYLLLPGGTPSPSPWTPGVVRVEVGGVKHHVALTDAAQAGAAADVEARAKALIERRGGGDSAAAAAAIVARLPAPQAALVLEALELACRAAASRGGPVVVILNADEAQGSLGRATTTTTATTLTEAVAAVFNGSATFALVQNVHSLPFGPYGGAARGSPALQAAWGLGGGGVSLRGALAVSRFVRRYLAEHSGFKGAAASRLVHVPLSAWGVFGAGPWPDFGGELAAKAAEAATTTAQQQQLPPPFVLACPKLTPEKGLGLVVQLARRLPDVEFVGVAAGDGSSSSSSSSSSSLPPNLRLLPPSPSPDGALRGAALCLCPSLWREAYGMAAVDAALRGVPVAASRGCGGLTEAVLLREDDEEGDDDDANDPSKTWPARLLPVEFVRVPDDDDGDAEGGLSPPWARREVPAEQSPGVIEAWAAAVEAARDEFFSRPREFARRSAATRGRAVAMVGRGEEELRKFLRGRGAPPPGRAAPLLASPANRRGSRFRPPSSRQATSPSSPTTKSKQSAPLSFLIRNPPQRPCPSPIARARDAEAPPPVSPGCDPLSFRARATRRNLLSGPRRPHAQANRSVLSQPRRHAGPKTPRQPTETKKVTMATSPPLSPTPSSPGAAAFANPHLAALPPPPRQNFDLPTAIGLAAASFESYLEPRGSGMRLRKEQRWAPEKTPAGDDGSMSNQGAKL